MSKLAKMQEAKLEKAPAAKFGWPNQLEEALEQQGLPEGYFEAFAMLYRDSADIFVARQGGAALDPLALWVQTAEDGVRGMAFVKAALASNPDGGRWRSFQPKI